MPELPEVHTTATMLNELLRGLRIISVWTNYNSVYHKGKDNIKDPKFFKRFARKISDACFKKIYRRGKNVLLELDNEQTIIVHMKMTGHLLYGTYSKIESSKLKVESKNRWEATEKGPLQDSKNQFIRFVITLSNGKHLALSDMRRFAKITLVPTEKLFESAHLRNLGPEPLQKNFTLSRFRERLLTKPRGKIKQVLMNPNVIAGIGNIYSDEMLYEADIHPLSVVRKVPRKAFGKLFGAMKKLLIKGIDFGGDSTSDYRNPLGVHGTFHHHHQAYRNTGKSCGKRGCEGTIKRIVIGSRSAHFCSIHQHEY